MGFIMSWDQIRERMATMAIFGSGMPGLPTHECAGAVESHLTLPPHTLTTRKAAAVAVRTTREG